MKRTILKFKAKARRSTCRKCGQAKTPWPGTDDLVCGCTVIAPLTPRFLTLPFSLPIMAPTARWGGVDDARPSA